MKWTRRSWLASAASTLCACALTPTDPGDRIIDTAAGQPLAADAVARRMREADFVLLGELHDNPHHHARRARLLSGLGTQASVVAEHLPRGAAPTLPADAAGESLRKALEAGGFDPQGWRWPLHEPLFIAIAQAGMTLRGGNLERAAARRVAREGTSALPADLAPWMAAAPLTRAAQAAMEQDLIRGHCGHLDAGRMPGMVAAQRARDAAMAHVLLAERERRRSAPGRHPVVLLAGNGHVRADYGVPTMLAGQVRGAKILTVGFLEPAPDSMATALPFDIAWITPPAMRADPCAAFPAARTPSA
jgi:uncharacterized iron-regulated protein